MRFEVQDKPIGREVTQRNSFFLLGVAPTREYKGMDYCPGGVTALTEKTTFLDGLIGVVTLGIYTPRSTTYHCTA